MFKKKFYKQTVLVFTFVLMFAMSVFADETSTVVTADTFTSIIQALQTQINVSTIMAVLVVVIGAGVGLAFMWWGVRKVISSIMAAFKKGKVKV